jgi:hypothetical protein
VQKVRAAENAGFTLVTFEDSVLPPDSNIRGRVDAVNPALGPVLRPVRGAVSAGVDGPVCRYSCRTVPVVGRH